MIEEGLYTQLSGFGPLTALVSTRIYPDVLPQDPTIPAVVYQVVGDAPEYSHDGPSGLERVTFQISCWGNNPKQAADVAEQVKAAVSGKKGSWGNATVGGCFVTNLASRPEPETGLHRKILDVQIWQEGA